LRFRFNRHADDGLRERRRLKHHVEILITQRVAGGDIAQTNQRSDVARKDLINILALTALNDHQATHPLAFASPRIVNGVTLLELAGIYAEEHQLARIRIGPELESKRAE